MAETGGDMSRFPSAEHLAAPGPAWPQPTTSRPASAAGPGPATAPGGCARLLIEAPKPPPAPKALTSSAQYRQVAARRGPNKATVAVAHSIVVVAWHMLSTGTPYHDLGPDWFSSRRDPEREARRLIARLEALGHKVTLTPAA